MYLFWSRGGIYPRGVHGKENNTGCMLNIVSLATADILNRCHYLGGDGDDDKIMDVSGVDASRQAKYAPSVKGIGANVLYSAREVGFTCPATRLEGMK